MHGKHFANGLAATLPACPDKTRPVHFTGKEKLVAALDAAVRVIVQASGQVQVDAGAR